MDSDTWVIGGQSFRIDATTVLDGGLAPGVMARVEFITLTDGDFAVQAPDRERLDELTVQAIAMVEGVMGDIQLLPAKKEAASG